MSDVILSFRRLCQKLAFWHADRAATNGRSYWTLDADFTEFHRLIRTAPEGVHEAVFADREISVTIPVLQCLRAAYEFDRERVWAQAVLEDRHPGARLEEYLSKNLYWALTPDLRRALSGCRSVLFAGSGPMPLTALSVATELGANVTCIEREPEAHALSRRIVEVSGCTDRIASVNADVGELDDLGSYDAVLGAVLLGVDRRETGASTKSVIAARLAARLRPGARLILREPHGLGRLLYPAVEMTVFDGFETSRLMPRGGPGQPYRSGLVVARRAPGLQEEPWRSKRPTSTSATTTS